MSKKEKSYRAVNRRGQYLIKENDLLVGVAYSLVKAKWVLEDNLGRLLTDTFKLNIKYEK